MLVTVFVVHSDDLCHYFGWFSKERYEISLLDASSQIHFFCNISAGKSL